MEQLQPGQMLGRYRILEQIGEGGMATVYKAYQPSMDRNVAIKVLPGQLADSPEFAQRFQQEARIIAKLEHPHILPVFDYGESNGITYLVMRYLDAGTLKSKMEADRPLPLDEIDRLFTQLAEALSYAHNFGIVHRDLKPSNALIDSQGNLFLTDFGIAKLLESASPRLTQTDAIMGTPAYISPEQAQASEVDQRSDIYSLGIILYEMVTGRVPYVAETPLAVILKHVSDPLPLPSTVNPDVPEAIEKVVLKALAKDPNDRFDTVAEFLAAWKRALTEAKSARRSPETVAVHSAHATIASPQPYGTSAPDTRQGTFAAKGETKSRGWAGWAIGCVVGLCALLAVGGGAFLVFNNMANQTPTETPIPTQTEVPTATNTNTPEPTATLVPVTNETLLKDDFSDNSVWGLLDEPDTSIAYDGETLRIKIFKKNWIVWTTPNSEFYDNVHTEVTAYNNDGESTTAFGIMCYQQNDSSSYYYGVITPGGEYAIAKAESGQPEVFLTNNDQWGSSDLIVHNADSYRIGMDCADGILALYVDGQVIDAVTDTSYTNGTSGLVAWSGESASSADVSFDDFIITSLK